MSSSLLSSGSSASRGEITIQPAYFTSSLFVQPLREDINGLLEEFVQEYTLRPESSPFTIFKDVWNKQGWPWLHLKVLERRGRESFLHVVCRLFLERTVDVLPLLTRVAALFAFWTFHTSQPSTSCPSVSRIDVVPLPVNAYESLLSLPETLPPAHERLRPYITFVLKRLVDSRTFLVLPPSSTGSENPRYLPREIFQNDTVDISDTNESTSKRKVGRPSKAEKAQKAKSALASLEKWLDRSSYPSLDMAMDPAGGRLGVQNPDFIVNQLLADAGFRSVDTGDDESTTHILLSQRPVTSLNAYRTKKNELVNIVQSQTGQFSRNPIDLASQKILSRMKEIASSGEVAEVDNEKARLAGLERVERAIEDAPFGKGGLLGLTEGSGLPDET